MQAGYTKARGGACYARQLREMTSTFNVRNEDRFKVIGEHARGTAIVHALSYLGNEYSDELVVI